MAILPDMSKSESFYVQSQIVTPGYLTQTSPLSGVPSTMYSSFKWPYVNYLFRLPGIGSRVPGSGKYTLPISNRCTNLSLVNFMNSAGFHYVSRYAKTLPSMSLKNDEKTRSRVMEAAYKNKNRYARDPFPDQFLGKWHKFTVSAMERTYKRYKSSLSGGVEMTQEEVIKELDLQKSCGFPWRTRFVDKKHFLTETIDWKPRDVLENFWTSLDHDNTAFYCFWLDKLKDEIRPVEKVNANKIRTFNCAPIEFVVASNRLCLDTNQAFYRDGAELNNWNTVGSTKYFGKWDRLIRKHLKVGLEHSYSADGGQWDARMWQLMLWVCCQLRCHWSSLSFKSKDKLRRIYNLLIHRIVYGEWGDVFWLFSGNPSGGPNTISDNTIGHSWLWNLIWEILLDLENERLGVDALPLSQSFQDTNLCLSLCGDDILMSISDLIKKWFSIPSIVQIASSIGSLIEFETIEPRHASECVYVSNTSTLVNGMWLPKPKFSRVIAGLVEAANFEPITIEGEIHEVDPRFTLLRMYAIRIESWGNVEVRDLLSHLITKFLRKYSSFLIRTPSDEKIHADVTWSQAQTIYKTDRELLWLYTGLESGFEDEKGSIDKMHSFPFIFDPMCGLSKVYKQIVDCVDYTSFGSVFDSTLGYEGEGPYCSICGLPKPEGHPCCMVNQSPYEANMIKCELCGIFCSGQVALESHFKGKQHLAKKAAKEEQKSEVSSELDGIIAGVWKELDLISQRMHARFVNFLLMPNLSREERAWQQSQSCRDRDDFLKLQKQLQSFFKLKTVRYGEADNPGPRDTVRQAFHRRKWYDPVRIAGELLGADRDDSQVSAGRRFVDALPLVGQIVDLIKPIPHQEEKQHVEFAGRDETKRRKRHVVEFQEKDLMEPDLADEFSPAGNHKGDGPYVGKYYGKKFSTGKSPAPKKMTTRVAARLSKKKFVKNVKKAVKKVNVKRAMSGNPNKVAVRTISTNTRLSTRTTGSYRVRGTSYMGELESLSGSFPAQFASILLQTQNLQGSPEDVQQTPIPFLDVNPYSVGLFTAAKGAPSKIQMFADYFEKFSMKLTWKWKHSCADTNPGQFLFFHDKDPVDQDQSFLNSEQIMQIATDDGALLRPYARDTSYTVTTGKLWCRQASGADVRKTSGGHVFCINTTRPTYMGTTCLGTWVVEYDIQFFEPCSNERIVATELTVSQSVSAGTNFVRWLHPADPISNIVVPADVAGVNPLVGLGYDARTVLILNHSFVTPMPTYLQLTGSFVIAATTISSAPNLLIYNNTTQTSAGINYSVDFNGATTTACFFSFSVFIPSNTPVDTFSLVVTAPIVGAGSLNGFIFCLPSVFFSTDWVPGPLPPQRYLKPKIVDDAPILTIDSDDQEEKKDSSTPRVSEPESWDHADLDNAVERAVARYAAQKTRWENPVSSSASPSLKVSIGDLIAK